MTNLFKIQQLLHHVSNDYETTLVHTYPSRTFQRYQEQVWKSQHDKTKQTTFLSKLMVAKFNGSIFLFEIFITYDFARQ
jgi:hypothetical protein